MQGVPKNIFKMFSNFCTGDRIVAVRKILTTKKFQFRVEMIPKGISDSGTIIYIGFFGAFSNLRMDLTGKRARTRNLLFFDPFLACPMANQKMAKKLSGDLIFC